MNPSDRCLPSPNDAPAALDELCGGFVDCDEARADCVPVPADDVPEPYRQLLVHGDHMTTTLGAFYGEPVRLRVMDERLDKNSYARKIHLLRASSDTVVEVGLVRIDFGSIGEAVRRDILARRRPLGDILIAHDVLRSIEPDAFFRFGPGSVFVGAFDGSDVSEAYGRIGTIYCHGEPAIRLLEIVADRRPASP